MKVREPQTDCPPVDYRSPVRLEPRCKAWAIARFSLRVAECLESVGLTRSTTSQMDTLGLAILDALASAQAIKGDTPVRREELLDRYRKILKDIYHARAKGDDKRESTTTGELKKMAAWLEEFSGGMAPPPIGAIVYEMRRLAREPGQQKKNTDELRSRVAAMFVLLAATPWPGVKSALPQALDKLEGILRVRKGKRVNVADLVAIADELERAPWKKDLSEAATNEEVRALGVRLRRVVSTAALRSVGQDKRASLAGVHDELAKLWVSPHEARGTDAREAWEGKGFDDDMIAILKDGMNHLDTIAKRDGTEQDRQALLVVADQLEGFQVDTANRRTSRSEAGKQIAGGLDEGERVTVTSDNEGDNHEYCQIALSKKDIGIALGLDGEDKKIADKLNALTENIGIILKKQNKAKHFVAVDTLPPTYKERFTKHLKKHYNVTC